VSEVRERLTETEERRAARRTPSLRSGPRCSRWSCSPMAFRYRRRLAAVLVGRDLWMGESSYYR
jgi:hypothetical protein